MVGPQGWSFAENKLVESDVTTQDESHERDGVPNATAES